MPNPWSAVEDLIDEVVANGKTRDDAANAAAVWLAEHVDFSELIPGPIGDLIEAIDDPLAKSKLAGKALQAFLSIRPFRRRAKVKVPEARASGNG